jgi:hypothetical protein
MTVEVKIGRAFSYVAALIMGGVLWEFVRHIPSYSIDPSLDIVALAALFMAVASLLLYRPLERARHSDEMKKTSIVKRLEACQLALLRVEELLAQAAPSYTDVVKACTSCRKEYRRYSKYRAAIEKPHADKETTKYELCCAELREMLTDTPPTNVENSPLRVENGLLHVAANRRVQVEQKIDELQELLYEAEKDVLLTIT